MLATLHRRTGSYVDPTTYPTHCSHPTAFATALTFPPFAGPHLFCVHEGLLPTSPTLRACGTDSLKGRSAECRCGNLCRRKKLRRPKSTSAAPVNEPPASAPFPPSPPPPPPCFADG